MSNLDAKLRTDLRVEIKRLHQKLDNTMIYVTHDQIEAMTLANRIAIMRDGLILQLDNPKTIYNFPVNKYVAEFIGSPSMNFLKGAILPNDKPIFKLDGGWCESPDLSNYKFHEPVLKLKGRAWLGIRPESTLCLEMMPKICQLNLVLKLKLLSLWGQIHWYGQKWEVKSFVLWLMVTPL